MMKSLAAMFACFYQYGPEQRELLRQHGKDGKRRRADIRSTPVDPVSLGLQVRTHRDHCKVTGRSWQVNSGE